MGMAERQTDADFRPEEAAHGVQEELYIKLGRESYGVVDGSDGTTLSLQY